MATTVRSRRGARRDREEPQGALSPRPSRLHRPKPGAQIEAAAQAAEIPKRALIATTDALDVPLPARAVVVAGGRIGPVSPGVTPGRFDTNR